jgi:hypothetical protein
MASISGTESHIVGKPERYDPGENTWTELADMPVPVLGHISLVYEDKIYVFGGDSGITESPSPEESYCTNLIQEYDPLTDEWRLMEPMPFNRTGMIGQIVGNYAYLFGGYPFNSSNFPSVLSEVWRFNLDSLIAPSLALNDKTVPQIQIFPNPTQDLITVQSREQGDYSMEIISLNGKVMTKMEYNERTVQVDLSSIPSGIYMIRVISGEKVYMGRVVKD